MTSDIFFKKMETLKSSYLQELYRRGFLNQVSNLVEMDDILYKKEAEYKSDRDNYEPTVLYCGFDLTADSLHIGHMIPLLMLEIGVKYGHRPIILLGGGTSKIGDPTGRDKERPLIDKKELQENYIGIKKSIEKIFPTVKTADISKDKIDKKSLTPLLANNEDWLSSLFYIDFLSTIGSVVSVKRMLGMESAKKRMSGDGSYSFLEFNYMLLQGYDFYYLSKTIGCSIQCSGQDQWGNSVIGIDIISKLLKKPSFVMTSPLLETSNGVKMSKSSGLSIWMNDIEDDGCKTSSSYEIYQFFINCEDEVVDDYINLFIGKGIDGDRNIIERKTYLALELVSLLRGEKESCKMKEFARDIYKNKILDPKAIEITVESPQNLHSILVKNDILSSRGEVKRFIKNGGIKHYNIIENNKLGDETIFTNDEELVQSGIQISIGKKTKIKIL
ncbi:MAG: tyrosine--tRNA ligase [Alphaproteobacteria bacterium]|nr:tyrosine--tRNA ligase [Alphaproteobacteria bacterium]